MLMLPVSWRGQHAFIVMGHCLDILEILGRGWVLSLVLQHVDAVILAENSRSYSLGGLGYLPYSFQVVQVDGLFRGISYLLLDILGIFIKSLVLKSVDVLFLARNSHMYIVLGDCGCSSITSWLEITDGRFASRPSCGCWDLMVFRFLHPTSA
jgi:hypothetical protein